MVDLQLEKLRTICAQTTIAGNRGDLAGAAPVLHEQRLAAGPAAGMEAGLHALLPGSEVAWALFIPVDVPLVPVSLLRLWTTAVLAREGSGTRLSYLRCGGQRQPTFCMAHHACATPVTKAIERVGLKLGAIFTAVAMEIGPESLWVPDAEAFRGDADLSEVARWFSNVNTPEDLCAVEGSAQLPGAEWDTGTGVM